MDERVRVRVRERTRLGVWTIFVWEGVEARGSYNISPNSSPDIDINPKSNGDCYL